MAPKPGDTFHVEGRGVLVFRTAEEIKDLAKKRDRLYAAGETAAGDTVKRLLKFTALIPVSETS